MRQYFWTLLASTLVVVASVVPVPETPMGDVPLFDKWVHFVMYGGIACAAWFDSYRHDDDRRYTWHTFCWTVLMPVVLGGVLELVQRYLTTTRSGEWLDFVADALGVAMAFPVGYFLIRRWANWRKVKGDG